MIHGDHPVPDTKACLRVSARVLPAMLVRPDPVRATPCLKRHPTSRAPRQVFSPAAPFYRGNRRRIGRVSLIDAHAYQCGVPHRRRRGFAVTSLLQRVASSWWNLRESTDQASLARVVIASVGGRHAGGEHGFHGGRRDESKECTESGGVGGRGGSFLRLRRGLG